MIKPGDLFGPFKIDTVVSSAGGMSVIYLASVKKRPDFKVALKVSDQQQPEHENRLRREADLLSTFFHPGIVRLFPIRLSSKVVHTAKGTKIKGQPWYFAMEYLPGGGLDRHLTPISEFPLGWRIELFYQLLLDVHYLHQRGYAHGDIKPENIVFRHLPAVGLTPLPVLIDFGSASTLDHFGKPSGTIPYAPPELIQALLRDSSSHDIDPAKVDIWALGAILYELIEGRRLVPMADSEEAEKFVLAGPFDTLTQVNGKVGRALETMLRVMLAPRPEDRPDTTQLFVALEQKISELAPPRIPIAF